MGRSRWSRARRRGSAEAIAAEMAASGARVMLSSRKQDALGGRGGRRCRARSPSTPPTPATSTPPTPASPPRSSASAASTSSSTTPPPTRTSAPPSAIDPGRFDKTFEVNVPGPVFWCRSAWERAFKDHPGVIINIASVGGLRAEGVPRRLQRDQGRADPPDPAAGRRARARRGWSASRPASSRPTSPRSWWTTTATRLAASLPLRRLGEPEDIAQPGHVPGQRRGLVDHRRDLRHRRRRRRPQPRPDAGRPAGAQTPAGHRPAAPCRARSEGSARRATSSRGAQNAGRRSLTQSRRPSRSGGVASLAGTTKATTRWPHSGSGRPATTTSATAGCARQRRLHRRRARRSRRR